MITIQQLHNKDARVICPREFLCSEAMYHLGVPTSRAVSLIVTNDGVPRDLFYNGNLIIKGCMCLCVCKPQVSHNVSHKNVSHIMLVLLLTALAFLTMGA